MIQNRKVWDEWENQFKRKTPPDFKANLRLLEAMYDEARALGVFPLKDPLEGLDRILNPSSNDSKSFNRRFRV